jgi:hypothetical protein
MLGYELWELMMSSLSKMVLGMVEVGSGLARFLTLGMWSPKWILTYCAWDAKRRHDRFERTQQVHFAPTAPVRSEADDD